jgi:hypothetical protein
LPPGEDSCLIGETPEAGLPLAPGRFAHRSGERLVALSSLLWRLSALRYLQRRAWHGRVNLSETPGLEERIRKYPEVALGARQDHDWYYVRCRQHHASSGFLAGQHASSGQALKLLIVNWY